MRLLPLIGLCCGFGGCLLSNGKSSLSASVFISTFNCFFERFCFSSKASDFDIRIIFERICNLSSDGSL